MATLVAWKCLRAEASCLRNPGQVLPLHKAGSQPHPFYPLGYGLPGSYRMAGLGQRSVGPLPWAGQGRVRERAWQEGRQPVSVWVLARGASSDHTNEGTAR